MKKWITGLTLFAFGCVIAVFALEFGLSKFAPHLKTLPNSGAAEDEFGVVKEVGEREWEFKHGKFIEFNSHGFRDKERTYAKGKNAFRIVVLGDSMTEGLQVPLEQTFPYILEEKLNSKGRKKFEVINLAVSGFDTAQEYLTLKHYGLKYQPDLVILAFVPGGDVKKKSSPILNGKFESNVANVASVKSRDSLVRKEGAGGKNSRTFQGVKRALSEFFPNIYYSLGDRIKETPWLEEFLSVLRVVELKPKKIPHQVYTEKYTPEWGRAWKTTKSLIAGLSTELKVDRIGFLVVVIPYEFEFRPERWDKVVDEHPGARTVEFDLRKPERISLRFFETMNIDYLLLRPKFEEYDKKTGISFYLNGEREIHWNANGHALTAELIYRKLKDQKLNTSAGTRLRANGKFN